MLKIPTFCRVFKKGAKKTYFEFLQDLRIDHASKLLIEFEAELQEDAADTIVYMACSCEVAQVTGEYFMSRIPIRSSYNSYFRKYQRELWALSEHLTRIKSSHYIVNAKMAAHAGNRLHRLIGHFFKLITIRIA